MDEADEVTDIETEIERYFDGLDGMLDRGEVTSTNVQALGLAIGQARRRGALTGLTAAPSADAFKTLERIWAGAS